MNNPKPKLGEVINDRTVIDITPTKHKKYKSFCYLIECNKCLTRKQLPIYCIYKNGCNSCYKKHQSKVIGKYMSNILYRAKTKNMECDIDLPFLVNLYEEQDGKCAISKLNLTLAKRNGDYSFTASLDRKDSSKGYTKDNVQWTHKWVNKMKLDFPQEQFVQLCNIIANTNLFIGTQIIAELKIEGIHRWKNCPLEEVAYLRDYHRHVFHIKVNKQVYHNDRDIEFIQLSHNIKEYLTKTYYVEAFKCCQFGDRSCEMIANELAVHFNLQRVEVTEDGEGGAVVTSL